MATAPDALQEVKRTPLYAAHQRAGARFTEFGGWDMPVQYSGLVQEHHGVRNSVGIFDVSHMGEIRVLGPQALNFLQYASSNDVSKLVPGKAQYSLLLNEAGGVVDDIIVYMFGEESYFLCVNAANTEKDFAWLQERNADGNHGAAAELINVSSEYAQIAVQGPKARHVMSRLCGGGSAGTDVLASLSESAFPAFSFQEIELSLGSPSLGSSLGGESVSTILACTGYTGEDGFEVFVAPEKAELLWESLLEVGAEWGILPAGLGARDTLRLEACYPLHGHELGDELSALCSNVSWVIKFDKSAEFYGKSALLSQKESNAVPYTLRGVEVLVPGIVREGAKLFAGEKEVGWVSSGTKTPTIDKAIGLAFVEKAHAKLGTELEAEVRSRRLKVKLSRLPFYKREAT